MFFFRNRKEISINAYNWYFYTFSLNQEDKKIKIGFNPLMLNFAFFLLLPSKYIN